MNGCGFYTEIIIESKREEIRQQVKNANKMMADSGFSLIKLELNQFHKTFGRYPTNEEGLEIFLQDKIEGWNGPRLLRKSFLLNLKTEELEYQYKYVGSEDLLYILKYSGLDSTFGTEDDRTLEVKHEKKD